MRCQWLKQNWAYSKKSHILCKAVALNWGNSFFIGCLPESNGFVSSYICFPKKEGKEIGSSRPFTSECCSIPRLERKIIQ
jgi:hypothetical protein